MRARGICCNQTGHQDGYRQKQWVMQLIGTEDLRLSLFVTGDDPRSGVEIVGGTSKHAEEVAFNVSDGDFGAFYQ